MAALDMHKSPRCQHVHYSGRTCKAPARRGRNYCVFHQAAHLDPGGCTLPIVEDLHSYQLAIIRIMQSLAADAIDSKKATALLYALQLLGGRLKDFVSERQQVEDPVAALKKEVSRRYDDRKYPFPSYIGEKDLLPILKEIRAEQIAEPNDIIEIIPQPQFACHPEADRSDAEGPMHFAAQSNTPPIGPSPSLPLRQDDVENVGAA